MAAVTKTTTTVKNLPAGLNIALRVAGCTKRKVDLRIINDDTHKPTAHNTEWDGGSRDYIHFFEFGASSMSVAADWLIEGQEIPFGLEQAVVVLSLFQGEECNPTVYVRNTELFALYGFTVPEGMPAEVCCDWLEEQAENAKPKAGNLMRVTAQFVRGLLGLVTAAK